MCGDGWWVKYISVTWYSFEISEQEPMYEVYINSNISINIALMIAHINIAN